MKLELLRTLDGLQWDAHMLERYLVGLIGKIMELHGIDEFIVFFFSMV